MRSSNDSNRKLLKLLLAGGRPQIMVSIFDIADSLVWACADHVEGHKFLSSIVSKHIQPGKAEGFINQVIKDHPLHEVIVNYVSREEYESIKAKLEAEY